MGIESFRKKKRIESFLIQNKHESNCSAKMGEAKKNEFGRKASNPGRERTSRFCALAKK